jgi:hypothetical protein
MDLSPEDSLRLHVLLASQPLAIRIDEGRMRVQGLTERGESSVQLNPNTAPERYLRQVRELISGHVLGSPGGYPVYLSRWTRLGQMRDESLAQLLLLGEPEAVVAAVGSPGLTDELARRAWWAMEDAGNARRMLANPRVRDGRMGPVLAEYLLQYLPFETDSEAMMESVRLILQPGLLDAEQRAELWKRSARKPAWLVGFLRAGFDDWPEPVPGRACPESLKPLLDADDPIALLFARLHTPAGQGYLKTVARILDKPPNQEVLLAVLDCLRATFAPLRPEGDPDLGLEALSREADDFPYSNAPDPQRHELPRLCPDCLHELQAMRFLSGVGYALIRPLLSDPTTQGTLMRRKLSPVLAALANRIECLVGDRN